MIDMTKKLNIAIVGLGQIGNYLYNELNTKKKDILKKTGKIISVSAISAKNINKKRKFRINKKIFYKDPFKIFKNNKIDILIEAIGQSDGISKKIVEFALKNKIHVVTPNKALISKHGNTCNYILSEMEETKSGFSTVLKKAQLLGYAEPGNPKLDLNGYDALAKVKILSALAFNNKVSNSKCLMEGIENIEYKDLEIANQLNYKIKLLGITEIVNNKLFERVHPCLIKKNTYIANVNGVMNAVIIEGNPVGESVLQGEGAGPGPTSSALMSDLLSILRGNIKYPFGISDNKRKSPSIYNTDNYSNALYIRLEVKDKPGVLSEITKKFAKHKISVQRLIQIPNNKNKTASIVIITHKSLEKDYQKCIKSFKSNLNIIKNPVLLRLF